MKYRKIQKSSPHRILDLFDGAVVGWSMESFLGKLKTEWLYGKRFRRRGEAKLAVFEYIELFYNRKRRRSGNWYISPLRIGIAA